MKKRDLARYDDFVEHPRFGRYPRFTGLDPDPDDWKMGFAWWVQSRIHINRCIPETTIVADIEAQQPSTFQVDHYCDIEVQCRECRRMFIFFAAEQRYWYETLKMSLDAQCVRCPECRKKIHTLVRRKAEYDWLLKLESPTAKEKKRLADCALALIEDGVFSLKVLQRVRPLLKQFDEKQRDRFMARIRVLEKVNSSE